MKRQNVETSKRQNVLLRSFCVTHEINSEAGRILAGYRPAAAETVHDVHSLF
jgi:hypothetical protein